MLFVGGGTFYPSRAAERDMVRTKDTTKNALTVPLLLAFCLRTVPVTWPF